jgi:hypothetical protein
MTSKKDLKKAINRFMYDVIEESSFQIIYLPETDVKKVEQLITDMVIMRNDWVDRINGARKVENQKSHFKAIVDEFSAKATEIVTSLYA